MAVVERNSHRIVARLEKEGWVRISQRGSHLKLRHPANGLTVIVPHPRKDLPLGTARKIAKLVRWLE